MKISKTWCPDCKREVLNVVSCIADGWEFTCGKCNQRFIVHFELKPTKSTDSYTCNSSIEYLEEGEWVCGLCHSHHN